MVDTWEIYYNYSYLEYSMDFTIYFTISTISDYWPEDQKYLNEKV